MHTTNYYNTLILPADDSKAEKSEVPAVKNDKPTVASVQYEKISRHPYKYTSDDIVFGWFAEKNDLPEGGLETARVQFFSKGQPCLRTSPLAKKYGFGIHSDEHGRIKLVPVESEEFEAMLTDDTIKKVKAMRSSKA